MPLYLGKTPMNGVISPQLGSQAIDSEVNTQAQKIAELSSILDGKAAGGGGAIYNATFTGSNFGIFYYDQDGILQEINTSGTIQPLNGVIVNKSANLVPIISGDYLEFPGMSFTYIIKSDVSVTFRSSGAND